MVYAFRVPLILVGKGIESDAPVFELHARENVRVWLQTADEGPISAAGRVGLKGTGFPAAEDARAAGERWTSVVSLAFARAGIGADFMSRRFFASYSPEFLATAPSGVTVLADAPGVTVHDDSLTVMYLSGEASGVASAATSQVLAEVRDSIDEAVASPAASLAFDLFSASATMPNVDARFLTLVMALEALIDPLPHQREVRDLVDSFMDSVTSSDLPPGVRQPLASRLRDLRRESIGEAGRRLVSHLDGQLIRDMTPQAFFSYCYRMRSKLSHGSTRPPLDEVNEAAVALEGMVGQLIAKAFTRAV